MTKVARGQVLLGSHQDGEPVRAFAVTSLSVLQGGDVKAWMHSFDPASEGNAGREHEIVTWVRFERGLLRPPWRLLDLYDRRAMVDRVDQAMRLMWVQGGLEGMKQPPDGIGVRLLQALFAGP